MSATTSIAWTHHTFNPWWGCRKVSPGCANCYAEALDKRFGGGNWSGGHRFFGASHWEEPLEWNRLARKRGERCRVFCASMADVFECGDIRGALLDSEREKLFHLIERTPSLDWLLLTKRPHNVLRMVPWGHEAHTWPSNVWIGTSVEDQKRADERIPELLQIPARIRFLSVEPLLGPVNLEPFLMCSACGGGGYVGGGSDMEGENVDPGYPCECTEEGTRPPTPPISWVIVGGESGRGARPCRVEWIRSVVRQCKDSDVPCFVKQLGAKPYEDQTASTWPGGWGPQVECILCRPAPAHETYGLRDPKGGDTSEWPEDLRLRELPTR